MFVIVIIIKGQFQLFDFSDKLNFNLNLNKIYCIIKYKGCDFMNIGIYEIKNTINNKRYIGSSIDLKKREKVHFKELEKGSHHSIKLQTDYLAFNKKDFIFTVLENCKQSVLKVREQFYIERFNSYNNGYNVQKFSGLSSEDVKNGIIFNHKKHRISIIRAIKLPETLTWCEKGRVDELRHYLFSDNQFLMYIKNKKYNPLTTKDMVNIFDISESRVRRFLNILYNCNIIKKIKYENTLYYAFNPIYGSYSKTINNCVYEWFKQDIDKYMSDWEKERVLKIISK